MKHLVTLLTLSFCMSSCQETNVALYTLKTIDIRQLEELNCYLVTAYKRAQSDLEMTNYFQARVTNPNDQHRLVQAAQTSKETIASIAQTLETLKQVGIQCHGNDIVLTPKQVTARLEVLQLVKTPYPVIHASTNMTLNVETN